MNLAELAIFRAVVEEGGMTQAGLRLGRVQSNITTRIRHLEDGLGTALFTRQGRTLVLTPAGRRLYDYALRIADLVDEACAAVTQQAPGGAFRLGSMESTAAVRLPPLLQAFAATYPTVEITLRTGNPLALTDLLLKGAVDAAFFAGTVDPALFDQVPAFEETLALVTRSDHPAISTATLPPTILVFETGCPHRGLLERWYIEAGEPPPRKIEMASYHAILGCVAAGMGAALAPQSVLRGFPGAETLVSHPLPAPYRVLTTHFVTRKGAASANAEALARLVAPPAAEA